MIRVLVAEDDSALREALRLVLEDGGYEVVCAGSLADLIGHVASDRAPDVVLIDAGLGGGGLAFWRLLSGHPEWSGRALLLTGDLRALGAAAAHPSVMGKPFDYGALKARIAAVGPRPPRSAPGSPEAPAERAGVSALSPPDA